MRVLRLGLGDRRTLDLHPAVSVVTGLHDHERAALRRGFAAIATGLAPTEPGLVEAHGLLLDTSQDDLDLLDLPASPGSAVATTAGIAGAVPDDAASRLQTAERDLLLLAADRWQCCQELAGSKAPRRPPPPPDPERAHHLRARIARHGARDAEPVRGALDEVRDAIRTGVTPDTERLAVELAAVGLDTTDLGLPSDELVRIAQDWLEERQHEADRVVGASIELASIEAALVRLDSEPRDGDRDPGAGDDEHDLWRRAARAATTHADAVVRADELRTELAAAHAPRPSAADIESHLLERLPGHRPARLAGTVPLVLDAMFEHLDEADVTHLLDRVAGLAGAVQVVVVDLHPAARAWGEAAGMRRAAVVEPAVDPVPAVRP